MIMLKNNIITDTLMPPDTIGYYVGARLAAEYPKRFVLSMSTYDVDIEAYAQAGYCALTLASDVHAEVLHSWDGPEAGLNHQAQNAWFEVDWHGQQIDVLLLCWEHGQRMFILADTEDVASRFVAAVSAWSAQGNGTVLVFENNYWQKNEELLKAIRHATFENLILDPLLKQQIREDLGRFLASRQAYEAYDVPWKRGILFIGPPGNGKTHMVKALVNEFGVTCLYVKELLHPAAIHSVFDQARRSSPCMLVLEDIDALAKAELRSALLNELDGFAANTGIVTLATTNHPEKLDAALLHRPSRFDRTYKFDLPGLAEREAYFRRWNESLQPGMRVYAEAIPHFADQTGGFSFAYLKELVVSATMRWVESCEHGAMADCLGEQLAILQGQMGSKPAQIAVATGRRSR
jgi:AAA+ superfamily predicted ATPase